MKHKYLIQISYAAPQDVMSDGPEAERLTGQFEWYAASREAARIWAYGLGSCVDLIEIVSVWEIAQ